MKELHHSGLAKTNQLLTLKNCEAIVKLGSDPGLVSAKANAQIANKVVMVIV